MFQYFGPNTGMQAKLVNTTIRNNMFGTYARHFWCDLVTPLVAEANDNVLANGYESVKSSRIESNQLSHIDFTASVRHT